MIFNFYPAIADDPKSDKIDQFEAFQKENYQELVYMQVDKQYYLAGEHIKFKIYCLEKKALKASQLSKVAYFELLDSENVPKLQVKVLLIDGVGYGDVFIPTNLNSGNYILRSYTRWMRNYGAETFYHSILTVINPFRKPGLKPAPKQEDISLQFFPESGIIIDGEKTKIVFEGRNANGYPIDFDGKLIANDTVLITDLKPMKNGMGSFEFTPNIINSYQVELIHEDGIITKHKIPAIKEKGVSLRVFESEQNFHVNIFCNDKSALAGSESIFYIIHGNGKILGNSSLTLSNKRTSFKIQKPLLDDGVSTISLFNSNGKLLISRNIFKYKSSINELSISLDKKKYHTREKVKVNISAMKEAIPGALMNLSISVAAYDGNYNNNQHEIVAGLLLNNMLKGRIYNPGSYFEGSDSDIAHSLDNLLIAYGNSIYSWQGKESIDDIKYIPEYRAQLITGKVWNKIRNEPAQSILTYLSVPGKKLQFYASKSRSDGSVIFEVKDFYGNNEIVIQNDYTRDTIYDIRLDNPFSEEYAEYSVPVFDIDESMKGWIEHLSHNMQIENTYFKYQPKLPSLSVIDSSNFYNEPDSRYYLDDFTRFIVMEEVMREYVYGVNVRKNRNGFHFMVLDLEKNEIYDENPLMLLDGVPVFDADDIIALDPLKVQKIETMKRRYFKGVLDCKGIVNYTTYEGDLGGYSLPKNATVMEYDGVQPLKQYYFPEYSSRQDQNSTAPDFRNTLFWNPQIKITGNEEKIIEFYTSDDINKYEIRVEGINSQGEAYSAKSYFQVVSESSN